VAWVLVRYRFPGRGAIDAMIDLPFALPTAVTGITLAALYAEQGWIGAFLAPMGVRVSYTWLGITVALAFIGLPFVVRSVQPVLASVEHELEEAAQVLGAGRWQTVRRVILPPVLPAVVSGMGLAFARGLGEYGSVVFISGNMPFHTEIAPLLIVTRLEEYNEAGATAIALVLLMSSFVALLLFNRMQRVLSRGR
jgi:sulfate transport system permease protein